MAFLIDVRALLLGDDLPDADRMQQQILERATALILYHGTSSVFAPAIRQQGLRPRGETGNSVYAGRMRVAARIALEEGLPYEGRLSLESDPDKVYLGHECGAWSMADQAVRKYGGVPMVFRVLVSPENLRADEDSARHGWSSSLGWENSCAHQGAIPASALLGRYIELIRDLRQQYVPLRPSPSVDLQLQNRPGRRREFYAQLERLVISSSGTSPAS